MTTRRKIVCLCGSTRFMNTFERANAIETLAGKVVLSVGVDMRNPNYETYTSGKSREEVKMNLDALHFDKIEMADEILILNVDGYIGESTRREIAHAFRLRKNIRFWEEHLSNIDVMREIVIADNAARIEEAKGKLNQNGEDK